ncbi:FAD/NAD(P)-binding protein [Leucobacter sp. NPDC077196]|uniref:FAD/NAD(P)-binding protein n=1 Tax=Leucobacter sp. NPDC077196 TaxID=3154959 RepID=UPI0034135C96
MHSPAIAIVGAGVRGTAALGRIAARVNAAQPADPLDIHVIDPFPPGSGRIWRDGQPRSLVMNTVPAHSTVFDDATLAFSAPFPGPDFASWCVGVAAGDIAVESEWVHEAAALTLPWSTPSRSLYGHYLRWAHRRFAKSLPPQVTLTVHAARARRIAAEADVFRIALDPSPLAPSAVAPTTIIADTVLLALGWVPRTHCGSASTDVPSENPIDQRIERIAPGDRVAVHGMGMGFTDLLSLVTEERGGAYIAASAPTRPGALEYRASGREPSLIAGSRSGLPFLAKPDFGAVPPSARLSALHAAIPQLVGHRPLDFAVDVLPLIERDAAAEYHRALSELHPDAYVADPRTLLDALQAPPDETGSAHWRELEDASLDAAVRRFDAAAVLAPFASRDAGALDHEIAERIADDAAEAALGLRSPWKRALHVFQAARASIIPLTDFGGTAAASTDDLRRYLFLAGLIGSGPPLFRVEQLLAAHRAGVVRFAGPGFTMRADPAGRAVYHSLSAEPLSYVDRVAEAFLNLPDAERLGDPLLDGLLADGLARTWAGAALGEPATLEITEADSALVGASGAPTEGLHSVGPLHEAIRRFTIIAPIPGTRSSVLREIDAAVESMLARTRARVHCTAEEAA